VREEKNLNTLTFLLSLNFHLWTPLHPHPTL
jgi:hypothetical protein